MPLPRKRPIVPDNLKKFPFVPLYAPAFGDWDCDECRLPIYNPPVESHVDFPPWARQAVCDESKCIVVDKETGKWSIFHASSWATQRGLHRPNQFPGNVDTMAWTGDGRDGGWKEWDKLMTAAHAVKDKEEKDAKKSKDSQCKVKAEATEVKGKEDEEWEIVDGDDDYAFL